MGINNKYISEHRLKSARDFESIGFNLHAMQIYYSILHDNPDSADANFALSELLERIGKITEAKKVLTDFLIENQYNNSLRLYLAQFCIRHSMWDDVIAVTQSFDIGEEPVAAFFLGYSYFMLKDYEQAKINFGHFINARKNSELLHEAYIYMAKTEIELKNFDSSLQYAQKAQLVYSNFWELNLLLAISYYNLNMYTHALSSIKKTMRLNQENPDVYKWGGKIFVKTGEYLKAEELFLKYISMTECPASETYSEIGDVLLKTNKVENAVQYYELALKIDPLNKVAAEGRKQAVLILEKRVNEI